MSDATNATGPKLPASVQEVHGHFPDDARLQDAQARLMLAGFDRAALSLPDDRPGTPNEGAANAIDDTDKGQLRTMGSSMAGYAGAAIAAGATLATGGALPLAIAAAAAVGAGTGLTANAAGRAADASMVRSRDASGREGTLVLAVRTTTLQQVDEAMAVMREAGASNVQAVERGGTDTGGVDSASWTGG